MENEKEPPKAIACSFKYILRESGGVDAESQGEAEAVLTEEDISLAPRHGEALLISLRDIEKISPGDYRLELLLSSGEALILYHLGYLFDDFRRELTRLRHEMLSKDLLMQECLRKAGQEAECALSTESGAIVFEGKAEPRLYETGLVIFPSEADPFRLPYSSIDSIEEKDYTLTLNTDSGETLVLSRMGRGFEPFREALSQVMNELILKVQSSLQEMLPGAGPAVIRKAARLMKEGKAARRGDLEALSPELWTNLEQRLEAVGIRHEYEFLSALSRREMCCIGMKRGLLGDLTGEYIWFLIPIYSLDAAKPGNVMAMEAASAAGGGRATYFFRLTGREDYAKFSDSETLDHTVEAMITQVNRCMLAINFRREPIYLPEEKLEEARYQKYRLAIRKIPALQELRRLFIGRVFHRSPEQWEQDVLELLEFNVSAATDDLKWSRGEQHLEDEFEETVADLAP